MTESPTEYQPDAESDPSPNGPPMSASLMGQLFAVPLLIISTIVGGAVIVVVLFGGPASAHDRPIPELLEILDSSSGERSLGLLLPREKELWQAALELSLQLKDEKKRSQLSDEELDSTARRLSKLVSTGMDDWDRMAGMHHVEDEQKQVRSRRLEFLIHALGRTQRPLAVDALIDIVRKGREPYVQSAIHELADLHQMPQTRASVAPMAHLLSVSASPETHLMACTALSVLASPTDQEVIDGLKSIRLRKEGEIAWSASLALARLGNSAGKSTLLDLLDRKFLSSDNLYKVDQGGAAAYYGLPPQRIEQTLVAAIDAASNLNEPEIWNAIGRLSSDESPVVRAKAEEAMKSRS